MPASSTEPFAIVCENCRATVPASAAFCPRCDTPRPLVEKEMRREAKLTGVPYAVLARIAWGEERKVADVRHRVAELERRFDRLEELLLGVEPLQPAAAPLVPPVVDSRAAVPGTALSPVAETRAVAGSVEEIAWPPPQQPVQDDAIEDEPYVAVPEESVAATTARVATPPSSWAESVRPPAPVTPLRPEGAARQKPVRSSAELEELIGGRAMTLIGGLAVLLGALFFFSLAFSRGWIGPGERVVIGVIAATVMVLGGGWFFERREAQFGHVLTAVGLGVMALSMTAATRLYDLVPVELGLAVSLATAIVAAVIAIRADLQIVAAYGIVSTLAAPPVLGAEVNGVTVALLATALAGTTLIALYRTWTWLPPLAFLLTAPQLASWIDSDASRGSGLLALAGFWFLHALAAGGEAFRDRGASLQPTSATLLVSNAAFLIWGGFAIGDYETSEWSGAFLLAVALAHGGLGGWFLRDRGDRHPFGMLAFGTGLAALTMAVPVQFGGAVIPLAWAAEATALAWVVNRLRNPFGAAAATLLGALAFAHLLVFEYPLIDIVNGNEDPAFLNANGLTLAFLLAALAVSGYVTRITTIRYALVTVGVGLTAYAMPFETSGAALVIGWLMLSVLALGALSWTPLRSGNELALIPGRASLQLATIGAWVLAVSHVLAFEYPIVDIERGGDDRSFLNANALTIAFLLAALAVSGYITRIATVRHALAALGVALLTYAMPFETSGAALVVGWSTLSVVAFVALRWTSLRTGDGLARLPGRRLLEVATLGAWALAAVHLLSYEYPIELLDLDLVVDRRIPFLHAEGVALFSLLAAAALAAAMGIRSWPYERHAALLGGFSFLLYAMPFELSGVGLIGGWAVMALLALAIGNLPWYAALWREPEGRRGTPLRHWGMALPAACAWSIGAAHWLQVEIEKRVDLPDPSTPFTDRLTLGALILIATAVAGTRLGRHEVFRAAGPYAALATAAVLVPFEVGDVATVMLWSLIALGAMALDRRGSSPLSPALLGPAILFGSGMLLTVGQIAPPERLSVDGQVAGIDHPFFWSGATLALGSLAIVSAAARWRWRGLPYDQWLGVTAGSVMVYLLSVGIIDEFQRRAGTVELESLQKQAQVALSILWAVLGVGVFACGIAWRRRPVRLFGLALLGLATVKVFLYDMASLDASYRVLSLIGLGVLLLVSSYGYQRFVRPLDQSDEELGRMESLAGR